MIRKTQKKTQIFRYKNKNNKSIGNKKTFNKNKVKQNHKSHRSNLQRTTTTSQLTLEGTVVVQKDLKEYGHFYSSTISNANTFRIHSQNIQNIPIEAYKMKRHGIVKELKKKIADVYLWQEVGLCWVNMAKHDTWKSRTQRLHLHFTFAYNNTDIENSISYQPGGVGLILINTMSSPVIGTGKDPTDLGIDGCGRGYTEKTELE